MSNKAQDSEGLQALKEALRVAKADKYNEKWINTPEGLKKVRESAEQVFLDVSNAILSLNFQEETPPFKQIELNGVVEITGPNCTRLILRFSSRHTNAALDSQISAGIGETTSADYSELLKWTPFISPEYDVLWSSEETVLRPEDLVSAILKAFADHILAPSV